MRLLPTEHDLHATTSSSVFLSVTCCGLVTYNTPLTPGNLMLARKLLPLICTVCLALLCHEQDCLTTLTKQSCGSPNKAIIVHGWMC